METITINDFKANSKEWLIEKLFCMPLDEAVQAICTLHDELHKYPKTYEECSKVLGSDPTRIIVLSNRKDIIHEENKHCYEMYNLYQLLICRDAYWKIAGDWKEKRKDKAMHYVICSTLLGEVVKDIMPNCIANYWLDFPTAEMRDIFYENFKDLIEQCKKLL